MSIRQNLQTRLGWAWALTLPLWCSIACAQTLGLPQVLEAARNNLDVSMARQAAEAARVPVLVAGWGNPDNLSRLAEADAPGTHFLPASNQEPARA
jgi:hypothetical protein